MSFNVLTVEEIDIVPACGGARAVTVSVVDPPGGSGVAFVHVAVVPEVVQTKFEPATLPRVALVSVILTVYDAAVPPGPGLFVVVTVYVTVLPAFTVATGVIDSARSTVTTAANCIAVPVYDFV